MIEFSDYIVYVDESGDSNLAHIDPNFPLFCLSFCVVKKSEYTGSVVPKFQDFKFKYFGQDLVILHEHEIRKSKGKFSILLTDPELRSNFYNDLNDLVQQAEMDIIAAVIKKQAHIDRYNHPYDPYAIALLFCMEKLHALLNANNQSGRYVHVVFESRGKVEDRELEAVFRRICDNQETLGRGVFRRPNFRDFEFEPVFASKACNSTGLQLADLTARPIALNTLRPEQDNRAYAIISPKLTKKVFP